MPTRRKVNPRLVKLHRSYLTEELAECLGVHTNTVRNWMRDGLEPIDCQRPYLFYGGSVRAFLERERAAAKQPCAPDELYCLRCRAPKRPAEGVADYEPLNDRTGDLQALCPDCEAVMHRRVNRDQFAYLETVLEIMIRPQRCA